MTRHGTVWISVIVFCCLAGCARKEEAAPVTPREAPPLATDPSAQGEQALTRATAWLVAQQSEDGVFARVPEIGTNKMLMTIKRDRNFRFILSLHLLIQKTPGRWLITNHLPGY